VVLFNESVIIQKLTCNILTKIDMILNKVSRKDRSVKTIDGVDFDFYRLKLLSDFVNNDFIQTKVKEESKLHPEFESIAVKDIVLKCILELEKEGYVERDASDNVEAIKEDYIYFVDKRKELYDFVLKEIKEAGSSGLKFQMLCNKVKSDISKFYNMEFLFTAIDFLYEQNQIIESDNQVYAAVE